MIRQEIRQAIREANIKQKDIAKYIDKECGLTCSTTELSMSLRGYRTSDKYLKILDLTERYLSFKKKEAETMGKGYFDKKDIMEKYDCGKNKALEYIRAIKEVNGGGVLAKGKVLPAEVTYWEEKRGRA